MVAVCNKADTICDLIIDNEFDLLALTETWLSGTDQDGPIVNALLPKGYSIKQVSRKQRGGGVALIHRDTVKVKCTSTQTYQSFEVLECLIHESVDIRLALVYRPPGIRSGISALSFMDEFSDYLSCVMSAPGLPLVLGDFNFHVDNKSDRTASAFSNVTSSFGLHQHVKGPTHKNNHTLDLVFSRDNEKIVTSTEVKDDGFPDHYVVLVTLAVQKPSLPKKTITYRKIKSISTETLRETIVRSPLSETARYDTLALNEIITLYNIELRRILDELAPKKQCTLTIRPHSKWYNETIRAAKQHRRQKERCWRITGLTIHRDLFIKERNKVKMLIAETKQRYYKEAILSYGKDTKQLFRMTSELLGKSVSSPLPTSKSNVDLADMFSDFFIRKIERIHDSIDTDHTLPEMTPIGNITPMLNFMHLGNEDVLALINHCSTKTCDLDPMPTQMVKSADRELVPVIKSIVNASLQSGMFPECLKHAIVTPRLKKPSLDPDVCANFRPVSNLSFLSKVLEKAVAEQLSHHLQRHKLFEPLQSAYRPLHSTETALVRVHDDICRAIGERKVVLLVMLDLSAAFDTVKHDLLLDILHNLGIRDTALQWFQSYLHNRDQAVKVHDTISDSRPLVWGVPQGSVLGPILFNLYSSSLGRLLRNRMVGYHLYADDSQIYVTVSPDQVSSAATQMEECIRLVSVWMSQHHLKMNNSKTEFLVLSSKHIARQFPPPAIDISGHSVTPSGSARNIGVIMDSRLSMEAHVANICRSAYFQLHCIAKVKKFLDPNSLECIIHAFVTTRLDHCNAILCGVNKSLKQKLQRVQNSAARLLTNTRKREHITPILRMLHWLPIERRIQFKVCVLTYKCIHGLAPPYLCDMIIPYTPTCSLRTAGQSLLCVPFTASDTVRNSAFSFVGPTLFNTLPCVIRQSESLETFKRQLKTHLFIQHFV